MTDKNETPNLPAVKVKPLVWDGFGLEMWAYSHVGRYYISGCNKRWHWSFNDDDPYYHGESAKSEEAAKAAAQADYEARILSALEIVEASALVQAALEVGAEAIEILPEKGNAGPPQDNVDRLLDAQRRADARSIRALASDPAAVAEIINRAKAT